MKKHLVTSTLILAGIVGMAGCATETDEPSPGDTAGDADGDTPREDLATAAEPLLDSPHAQAFGASYGTPDFSGGDWFGYTLATGDLNEDGAADLIVGVPHANQGSTQQIGAVRIIWGGLGSGAAFGGLTNTGVTQLYQRGGVPSTKEFGSAIAVGDFNCDGHLDLAVGAPSDDLPIQGGGSIARAGSVNILYGPAFTGWQLFWQGSAGIPGVPESFDEFGRVLTAGNFNGDTSNGHACDDLAIGTPREGVNAGSAAGSVTVLYGRSTGLNTAGAPSPQLWHQDVGSVFGVAETGDNFGAALAAGDFNHDGKTDLAIGVPFEGYESAGVSSAGLVQVLKGSSSGLTDTGNYVLELTSFPGLALQEAQLGFSLARGDFDHDGDDDLAVGAPHLASGGATQAGSVLVYRQTGGVLAASLRYDQNNASLPGVAEANDLCGSSLAAGDFNGDGQDDLASGCPGEAVTANGITEGAFNTAYFGFVAGSFAVVQGQLWHRNSAGIPDQCVSNAWFSRTLAAGDFNGDGKADLAAGEFYRSYPVYNVVNAFYGAP